jgi:hypothetical protein
MIGALFVIAVLIALIGWVWLMIAGFVEAVPWGIGIFFFSPLGIVFSLFHWPEYKIPTFLYIGGVVLYFIAIGLSAAFG